MRRLLTTAATEDPAYAAELAAAVAALPDSQFTAAASQSTAAASRRRERARDVPAGSAGDREAFRRLTRRGLAIGVGAVAVTALLGCLVGRAILDDLNDAGGLTSDSSCAEFRQAPAEDRVAAIRQIGLAKGISGVDSPLVMSAVDQLCDAQPSAKLGDMVARFDR